MKRFFTTLLLLTLCLTGFAQHGGKEMHEKVRAQKVAHITKQLELTPEEAQNFWPVYNTFEDTKYQIRRKDMREIRALMKRDDITEDEAQQVLKKYMALEEKIYKARKKLSEDLMKVLPAKKIIKLKAAEDSFNRLLMNKLKDRRSKYRKN